MKNREKNVALVAAGIMLGAAIAGPAAQAAEMLSNEIPLFLAPDDLHISLSTHSDSFLLLLLRFDTYLLFFEGQSALAPYTDELFIPSA